MTNPSPDLPLPQVEAESVDSPELRELVDSYVRFFMTDEPGQKGEEYWKAIIGHITARVAAARLDTETHLMMSYAPLMDAVSAQYRIDKAEAALAASQAAPAQPYAWLVLDASDVEPLCTVYREEATKNYRALGHKVIELFKGQAAPAKAEGCTWTLDDDENGTWASSCGELWGFNDGGPQENRVSFCHHCGGKVHISTPAKEPT